MKDDKVKVRRLKVGMIGKTNPAKLKLVKVYEWRWTRFAGNGAIVGASTEGYRNRKECLANAMRCMKLCEVEIEK